MVCECSRADCTALIVISIREYEAVRSDARDFAVVSDHIDRDVETIVRENDRFAVVRKHEGDPADVAEQEDPRS
jgi:hypothetical protein